MTFGLPANTTLKINDYSIMKRILILFVCLSMAYLSDARETTFTVTSPDMADKVSVTHTDAGFTLHVCHDGKPVFSIENISMTVDGTCWNGTSSFRKAVRTSTERELHPVAPRKFSVLEDCHNELSLEYRDYAFQVRVYNEGLAYRFCGKSDRRDVHEAANNGDKRAALGVAMETHRIKKYIGAYAALLGRVDAIVFTAGVGEMGDHIRKGTLEGLESLGIIFDEEKKILTIATPSNNSIEINDDGQHIKLADQHKNEIVMDSGGITLTSAKDITLNAKGGITMDAASNISGTAKADISLEGNNVKLQAKMGATVKGNATAELSASGQTTVKGAVIMLN